MKPKISVIVPHWPIRPEHDDMLDQLIRSIPGEHEIIVVVNDGIGMGKAINIGLRLAHGDYLVVSNNDVTLAGGVLEDLCIPNNIGAPLLDGREAPCSSFYCMARSVYEKVGGYDEQFEVGYFEDDDLHKRWALNDIRIENVKTVNIHHSGGATLDKLGNREAIFRANKERFDAKWQK